MSEVARMSSPPSTVSRRLIALDALRGFSMFWLLERAYELLMVTLPYALVWLLLWWLRKQNVFLRL